MLSKIRSNSHDFASEEIEAEVAAVNEEIKRELVDIRTEFARFKQSLAPLNAIVDLASDYHNKYRSNGKSLD